MQGVDPPAPVFAEEKCSSQGQRGPHSGSEIDWSQCWKEKGTLSMRIWSSLVDQFPAVETMLKSELLRRWCSGRNWGNKKGEVNAILWREKEAKACGVPEGKQDQGTCSASVCGHSQVRMGSLPHCADREQQGVVWTRYLTNPTESPALSTEIQKHRLLLSTQNYYENEI